MLARLVRTRVGDDLLGVHVADRARAHAVGRRGVVLCWDGVAWADVACGVAEDLYAACGAGGDLYAVGGNLDVGGHSLVVRRRGDAWTARRSGIQSVLLGVAAGGGAVRAVGFNGGAVELAGDVWREVSAGTHQHLFAIRALPGGGWVACGLDGAVVWIAPDGSARVERVADAHLTCLAVAGDTVFAVGFGGTFLRHDAAGWTRLATPVRAHLWSVWCGGAAVLAVGAGGTMLQTDGRSVARIASPTDQALHAIDGQPDFAIAVGDRGVIVEVTAPRPSGTL